jgi:hypothetical protein
MPVVSAVRNVVSYHHLHSPVGPFGLAVGFRVEEGGHGQPDLEKAVKVFPNAPVRLTSRFEINLQERPWRQYTWLK